MNFMNLEKMNEDKALRYNENKPKWSYVHFKSLLPMVRVLEKGAKKYAPFNWQKPMDLKEIEESAMRHLTAIIDGEDFDPETGELHIGHLMCNCLFWSYQYNKLKEDDSSN